MSNRSDNSEKHPYTKPSFWQDSKNWFWYNGFYSAKSIAYFTRFVEEQGKIAGRKFK